MTMPSSQLNQNPPRWAERLLRRLLSPADRDTITGDLLEEYREVIVPTRGVVGARRWYLRQALSVILAPHSSGHWLIWLFATSILVVTFVTRYHLGPPFPDLAWATLGIATAAIFSVRAANVRFLTDVSLRFGLFFAAVAAMVSVGAALIRPLNDTHAVLTAYSGVRGEVFVACCASVFVAAGLRGASGGHRMGVGTFTAMGTALVGAVSWMLFVTSLGRLSPDLLQQLGPKSAFAWPAAPFNLLLFMSWLNNYLTLITLSVVPGCIGAMLGRAFATLRGQRRAEPAQPAIN